MEFLNKIPPNFYLIISLTLITTAIGILFLGKFIFAILSLILWTISLVAWIFLGLFKIPKEVDTVVIFAEVNFHIRF